jgi:hypothetical protein
MAAICPPGDQNVSNDTTNPAAWNENTLALPPSSIQFVKESLIILDPPELMPASVRSIGF